MSSTNNIENPDILSPQEDIFYKQNIDLLHSNFLDKDGVAASEVLDVLKDIFTELEEKNPPNDSSIGQNPKDHTFGVLDYEKIFSLANHEQLIELFNFLTTLKEVEKNEIAPLEQLYYFISGALLHARKHEKTQLTWNSLVEYLNLDVLVRTYHVRTDFPENLRTSLSKYFKNLPNFNLHSATQEDSTYEAHFLLASKLKSVFYFATEKEITNNTELMNMLNNIMNFQPSDSKISTLRNYVTNIYYNGMANEEQVEEIDDLIEEFTSETEL
jgi:hypothetical protein